MEKANDLSRPSTVLEQNSTVIAVIEMSLSSWLVAGIVPGLAGQSLLPRPRTPAHHPAGNTRMLCTRIQAKVEASDEPNNGIAPTVSSEP
jgi:hypothetical protein